MSGHRTLLHKIYTPLKRILPSPISNVIRSFFTAMGTPLYFSLRSGHFKSSFKRLSVSAAGDYLPWYTYPMIDFLRVRDFSKKNVLEFGGGHSTLWWAQHASTVVSFEDNRDWYELLRKKIPSNVKLHLVSDASVAETLADAESVLKDYTVPFFDVIIIDGLCREHMIDIAQKMLNDKGIIICDNAEGYGFYEAFKNGPFQRIDFYGHAPGVLLPHCTALYFKGNSFVLDPQHPMPTATN